MANFKIAIPILARQEGGLSNNPKDNAAKDAAPNGYHTNKGVTWATFRDNAKALDYVASQENFMLMPESIKDKIAKRLYWDVLRLDEINSNKKAYLLFDFAFNSGTGTAIVHAQKVLGIAQDYKAGPQFVGAVNAAGETYFSEALTNERIAFIRNAGKINETLKPGLIERARELLKKKYPEV